jgi:hypothetical protein
VNRIGASRLYQFATYLKVPVGYFFEDFDEESATNPDTPPYGLSEAAVAGFETEQLSSKETIELIRGYYSIPSKKVRKSIFDLTKTLSGEYGAPRS